MQATTSRENGREVRRRSRLACDSCARARVKCDGGCPCRRCEVKANECHYDRDVRKRGRKRKDQNSTHVVTDCNPSTPTSLDGEAVHHAPIIQDGGDLQRPTNTDHLPMSPYEASIDPRPRQPTVTATRAWDETLLERSTPDRHGVASEDSQEDFWYSRGVDATPRYIPGRNDGQKALSSLLSQDQDDSYACLGLLLPHLQGILKPQLALKLLELYFAPPEGTLFHNASPYVLTPVLRRESVLNATSARPTTPALLATMIWVTAQTASLPELLAPGSRSSLISKLEDLVFKLHHDRDPDNWQRVSGGHVRRTWYGHTPLKVFSDAPDRPTPVIDDVLSLILITIVTSGGDFKRDCLPWWNKALALVETMKLHQLDSPDAQRNDEEGNSAQLDNPFPHPRPCEAKEEMRRTYWLAFALDRHLALSYNGNLALMDGESYVYTPLPERAWQAHDEETLSQLSGRQQGPSILVTGTSFFEFFLPLMVLLGDIVHLRRNRHHPRLGSLEGEGSIALVEKHLERCKQSIYSLGQGRSNSLSITESTNPRLGSGMGVALQAAMPGSSVLSSASPGANNKSFRVCLVTAYAHFILHVLYVLLHGEWDALTMLAWLPSASSQDEWITSPSFHKCSSHAVFASEAIYSILEIDPELIFMPYLFGIYLFHGSLVLLLFADRMPAVHGGPNSAVEAACETIIRAHEACIVTLNTEFQRVFKRVMRATLMVVKDQNKTGYPHESGKETDSRDCHGNVDVVREKIVDMRKDMLKLYRWNRGGRGLAI